MKRKEIINLIKKESNDFNAPNLSKKIMDNMVFQNYEEVNQESSVINKKGFTLSLFTKLIVSCIIILFVGIVGINMIINDNYKKMEITEVDKTYASQIVTLCNVAGNYSLQETRKKMSSQKLNSSDEDSLENIGNTLSQYILSVNSLFQKDNYEYELYTINEEYKYLMIVKNGSYEYKILYNETIENEKNIIKGIIKTSISEFKFISEINNLDDECYVTIELFVDEVNSFVLSQEIKNSENVYNISYKYNENVLASFILKTIITDDNKKVQLIIDEYTEFVFIKTVSGYSVDYKVFILSGSFKIEETEEQYIYTFNDFSFEIDK